MMDLTALHGVVETCLTWIGFGVVCGMLAKAIMPGRDPGGTLVTFFLGIGGSLIGAATYAWATGGRVKDMISLIGFAVATGGALVLLLMHRLLAGRMYNMGAPRIIEEVVVPTPQYSRRRRGARYSDVD